jgi:hypothetical protein
MILRLLVCIGMDIFCVWQGIIVASVSSDNGHHYFPFNYIICIVLLSTGLNKFGLISWPLTTVILLFSGHWFIGWIPFALVLYNVLGNKIIKRKEAKENEITN